MGKADRVLVFLHANIIDPQGKTGLPSVLRMPRNLIRTVHSAPGSRAGRLIVPALLLALCATPLFAGLPRAQKHELRHEIDQIEDTWRAAILKGDTSTISSLLADDYMAISPSGTLQTKEESLASIRAGGVHFVSLDISDRKVRFYGDTAVVTSLADVHATTPNGNVSGAYRYTRVYVRDAQGAWKIVSFEASRITDPAEHSKLPHQ
jgi:ketosteroid isomerase-like protein